MATSKEPHPSPKPARVPMCFRRRRRRTRRKDQAGHKDRYRRLERAASFLEELDAELEGSSKESQARCLTIGEPSRCEYARNRSILERDTKAHV